MICVLGTNVFIEKKHCPLNYKVLLYSKVTLEWNGSGIMDWSKLWYLLENGLETINVWTPDGGHRSVVFTVGFRHVLYHTMADRYAVSMILAKQQVRILK